MRDAWFVRIGLAPPSVPERVLSKWFRDMAIDDQAPVSCSRLGMVRNAWCEILQTLNLTEVALLVSSLRPPCTPAAVIPDVVTHVHDEAVMRMRCHLLAPTDDKRASGGSFLLRRAKHSKILDSVISLHAQGTSVAWYDELLPLAKKDGPSVAAGLLSSIRGVVKYCGSGLEKRMHKFRRCVLYT